MDIILDDQIPITLYIDNKANTLLISQQLECATAVDVLTTFLRAKYIESNRDLGILAENKNYHYILTDMYGNEYSSTKTIAQSGIKAGDRLILIPKEYNRPAPLIIEDFATQAALTLSDNVPIWTKFDAQKFIPKTIPWIYLIFNLFMYLFFGPTSILGIGFLGIGITAISFGFFYKQDLLLTLGLLTVFFGVIFTIPPPIAGSYIVAGLLTVFIISTLLMLMSFGRSYVPAAACLISIILAVTVGVQYFGLFTETVVITGVVLTLSEYMLIFADPIALSFARLDYPKTPALGEDIEKSELITGTDGGMFTKKIEDMRKQILAAHDGVCVINIGLGLLILICIAVLGYIAPTFMGQSLMFYSIIWVAIATSLAFVFHATSQVGAKLHKISIIYALITPLTFFATFHYRYHHITDLYMALVAGYFLSVLVGFIVMWRGHIKLGGSTKMWIEIFEKLVFASVVMTVALGIAQLWERIRNRY